MFSLRDFVMKTIRGMVGQYPEFQVREYALKWYSKGVLTDENLVEIDKMYEAKVEESVIQDEYENEEL